MSKVKQVVLLSLVLVLLLTAVSFAEELVIWHEYTGEPQKTAWKHVIDLFKEKNPDVVIKETSMGMENMKDVLKTAISAGVGPDLFLTGPGWGGLGPFIQAGLIEDLSPYYQERGWDARVLPWAKDYVTYNKKVWSFPWEAESQGVFYHKDIFKEVGVDVPETYEEFVEIGLKMVDAGYMAAISTAARPAYALGWLESSMLGATIPDDKLKAIVFDHESWNQPVYVNAVDKIKELYTKGLVDKNVLAYSTDDMSTLFYSKMIPMEVTGTWIVPELETEYADMEIGFFIMPPLEGVERRAPKAVGGAWQLSATSKHKETALKFLDHLSTDAVGNLWLEESRLLPPLVGLNLYQEQFSTVRLEAIKALSAPKSAFNLYGVLPTDVNNATWNNIQKLWDGKITVEELVEEKDALWQKAIEEGRVFK